jgi:hypothetical protein
VGADGQRRTLLDEIFRDAAQTPLSLGRPEEGIALAGLALQKLLKRALPKLYESNIQQISSLPITEASAPRPVAPGATASDPAKTDKK